MSCNNLEAQVTGSDRKMSRRSFGQRGGVMAMYECTSVTSAKTRGETVFAQGK